MLRWRVVKLIGLEAGPQFNFLTNAERNGTDISDDLKENTTCLAFGGLVHLPLGFNGGVRYVMGISDLSDLDNIELKDATFQVYIGWTIFGAK
jgi:hypothetical protein